MKVSSIQSIINKARDLNLYDNLVIIDDNYHMFYVKTQTHVGYFDNGNELFVSLSVNENPIQYTMNEPKMKLEFVDYDHITSIFVLPTEDALKDVINTYDFDKDAVKTMIRKVAGSYMADGFLYNKGKQAKTNKITPEIVGNNKVYDPEEENSEEDNG